MEDAHLDFETASTTDLRTAGLYRYAEDPNTRVWGFSWQIGSGPILQWRPGYIDPTPLLDHVAQGGRVVAHNAAFERTIWNKIIRRLKPHWPEMTIAQQICTMARAQAVALPADLDRLSEVLEQKNRKDVAGATIMKQLMRPRSIGKDGTIVWWDEPAKIDRLMAYCDQDVRTEHETDTLIPQLSPYEQELWYLDQRINERGIKVDVASCHRAVELVELSKRRANQRIKLLTQGAVEKTSQDARIIAWLKERGIEVATIKKSEEDEIMLLMQGDDVAQEVIKLRNSSNKTSTAKYKKMLGCVCEDGRIRGTLGYHVASTGRWGGRLIQPHNLPRLDMEKMGVQVSNVIDVLSKPIPASESYDLLEAGIGTPLHWLSKALRPMIVAEPGNVLIGADFKNIEGRVNAWLAGEQWKLEAFAAYDRGEGHDLYNLSFMRSFGIRVEEQDFDDRQIGKVQELACGYQGSVGAYITMGVTYGLQPHLLVAPIKAVTSAEDWDAMAIRYAKSRDKYELPEEQWVAIKLIVKGYRETNPNIVQAWWDLGDAAVAAVDKPGTIIHVYHNRVRYMCDGNWLYCSLPSGRVITYASPRIEEKIQILVNDKGEEYERVRRTVSFWGIDGVKNIWRKEYLYGGLQCENIVSGVARDALDHALFRLERAGFPIVLHVHDEAISELLKGVKSKSEFKAIMSETPGEWANGLPIAVSAWEGERYMK